MDVSPEYEFLDQLGGEDMPLRVLLSVFRSRAHARDAITAMLRAGDIRVLDSNGSELAMWQWENLTRLSDDQWEGEAARFTVSITDQGLKRI